MRKLIVLCLIIALGSCQFLSNNYSNFDMNRHQQEQPDFDQNIDNQIDSDQDDQMFRPVGGNILMCIGEVTNLIKNVASMISQVRNGNINIIEGVKQVAAGIKTVKAICISGGNIDPEINNTIVALQSTASNCPRQSLLTKLCGLLAKLQVKLFF